MTNSYPTKRFVDPTGLVWQTTARGGEKIIGEVHKSKAGRYKVVMVGTCVAKSLTSFDEAKDVARTWVPEDDTTADILAKIVG